MKKDKKDKNQQQEQPQNNAMPNNPYMMAYPGFPMQQQQQPAPAEEATAKKGKAKKAPSGGFDKFCNIATIVLTVLFVIVVTLILLAHFLVKDDDGKGGASGIVGSWKLQSYVITVEGSDPQDSTENAVYSLTFTDGTTGSRTMKAPDDESQSTQNFTYVLNGETLTLTIGSDMSSQTVTGEYKNNAIKITQSNDDGSTTTITLQKQ